MIDDRRVIKFDLACSAIGHASHSTLMIREYKAKATNKCFVVRAAAPHGRDICKFKSIPGGSSIFIFSSVRSCLNYDKLIVAIDSF